MNRVTCRPYFFAEISFSCVKRIHNCLRHKRSTEKLDKLVDMNAHMVPFKKTCITIHETTSSSNSVSWLNDGKFVLENAQFTRD